MGCHGDCLFTLFLSDGSALVRQPGSIAQQAKLDKCQNVSESTMVAAPHAMIASLVVNGRAEQGASSRPAEVLRRSPAGPYTVTVIQEHCIEAWERHLERLSQAVEALCSLSTDGKPCGGMLYAGLAARLDAARGEHSLSTYIRDLVKPAVMLAELGIRMQPGSQAAAPTLITILLHPCPGDRCAADSQPLVHPFCVSITVEGSSM